MQLLRFLSLNDLLTRIHLLSPYLVYSITPATDEVLVPFLCPYPFSRLVDPGSRPLTYLYYDPRAPREKFNEVKNRSSLRPSNDSYFHVSKPFWCPTLTRLTTTLRTPIPYRAHRIRRAPLTVLSDRATRVYQLPPTRCSQPLLSKGLKTDR